MLTMLTVPRLGLDRLRRRAAPVPAEELVEVVTPRTNAAIVAPAENFLATISLPGPFGLELAASATARWFLVRAGGPAMRRHLESQLAAAYPQADLNRLEVSRTPGLDPAAPAPDEQVAACALVLRGPAYLPLRTFRDAEVDAAHDAQADPVLGILGALDDLPEGWRALAQLVLRPAPADWCRGYLRLAVEHPLAHERAGGWAGAGADTSLASVFALAGLLAVGAVGLQASAWYGDGDWGRMALLAGGLAAGVPGVVWARRRLAARPLYDPRLVQEKVSRPAFLAEPRLAVFAPTAVPRAEVEARLGRLAAAYRQFDLAAGNGLAPRRLDLRGRDLRTFAPLAPRRAAVLTTRELAGLWHLPQAGADVPLLERTTARERLPLPASVARGCRIGVSAHQGRVVPVALPEDLLRRHLLLVAKTRRGKSSLLLRLARHAMDAAAPGGPGGPRPALVLVDPHRDLARAALGLVPPARRGDVVFLDVARRDRPFGLNLLDTALFADRDKAVSNALGVFRREFDRFWGPRMEDCFRFALLTLYEANQALCAADPHGRARQHTVLEVPAVLVDAAFRRTVLAPVADPVVRAWWSGYFDLLDRRLQIEIANPVQTKVQRFAGSRAARSVVGQPASTIDPGAWLREGAVVVVDGAKGDVGEDTAALVGATLLNLVGLAVGEQARLAPADRRPVTIVVDEFQAMPGADYEAILSELAKYGANLVLATQSLAKLAALDREQHRALRASVFANVDGLFAFHCSAEDAEYLVRELGEGVDEADLVALGEHRCYARLSAGGERLPAFSVRLDPPPAPDPGLADALAAASADRYGRPAAAVEEALCSALARIELARKTAPPAGAADAGVSRGGGGDPGGGRKPARNQHRNPNKKKAGKARVHQGTLIDPALVGKPSGGGPALAGEAEGPESNGEEEPEEEPSP
jgi:hypothetical protein